MKNLYGLSSGKINLKNGNSKYFNVFENNTDNDTLVLVKEVGTENYTVIAGSGSPAAYSDFSEGVHLNMKSGGRSIKHARGVGVFPCTENGLNDIYNIVRKNRCSFWVFK